MKNKYPIQVLDLRHQVDNINPEKIQLSLEFLTDAAFVNTRLFVLLIRHRQFEMIADGNNFIDVKVVLD